MKKDMLEKLAEANSLLRSAYAIALRDGKDINWEAFRNKLKNILETEQEILKGYWQSQSIQILSTFENLEE